MSFYLREYILFILISIFLYSFIKIYLRSKSFIKESDKIKRESVLIYSKEKDKSALSAEINGIVLKDRPDMIYESKMGDFIVINHQTIKGKKDDDFKIQMGVYFILIEKTYNRRPSYGIIEDKKARRFISIENTDELKTEVIKTIQEIKQSYKEEKTTHVHRSHEDPHLCLSCAFRIDCEESLA